MADHEMKRPNPLPPNQLTPVERRAELCALLALGLVRLLQRERGEPSDGTGEIRLHYPADRCRHASPNPTETA
jgi:hypothetical protein